MCLVACFLLVILHISLRVSTVFWCMRMRACASVVRIAVFHCVLLMFVAGVQRDGCDDFLQCLFDIVAYILGVVLCGVWWLIIIIIILFY